MIRTTALALVLAAAGSQAFAAVSVNNAVFSYSQNFDTLAATGTSVAWANDSTLAGWSLFNKNSATPVTYRADDGASNSGSFYSYRTTGSGDRALGGLGSGGAYFGSPASDAVAGWIAASFTNNTGSTLSSFTLGFDGEQWRKGGVTSGTIGSQAQTMVFQYGFGSSFASVSAWATPGGNFDWTTPVFGETSAAALNGNSLGLSAGHGGTISTPWNNGDTLWVRWVEKNDANNDHGLAIDNFSLAVAAVPEPTNTAMLLAGLGVMGFIARRRSAR